MARAALRYRYADSQSASYPAVFAVVNRTGAIYRGLCANQGASMWSSAVYPGLQYTSTHVALPVAQ
jgi:hypothetical protein